MGDWRETFHVERLLPDRKFSRALLNWGVFHVEHIAPSQIPLAPPGKIGLEPLVGQI